jgi:hypothetical protein
MSIPSGCKTWISDVPSWGILSTKVKLDNEEDEDTTFVIIFDDKNTKLRTSMTKTIKMRCNIKQSSFGKSVHINS